HAEDAEHTKGTRQELLDAARKTGVRIVMMTEHNGPKADTWRGLHDGVLFIAGAETDDGPLWFPDYGPDGKPSAASGLRFLSQVEEHYDATTDGMAGMEICNRHTDKKLDKDSELYLSTAAQDPKQWQAVLDDFHTYADE